MICFCNIKLRNVLWIVTGGERGKRFCGLSQVGGVALVRFINSTTQFLVRS